MNAGARPPDDIDLIALAARLWAGRWWVISITCIAVLVALIMALRTPVVFEAQAIAVVASVDEAGSAPRLGQLGGLAALAGISIDPGSSVEEALAVLRSREFTERFIDEHQLLAPLFPERWNKAAQAWNRDARVPTGAEAYRRFDRDVRTVSQDGKTGLIVVSVLWPEPGRAAELANGLVQNLNQEMRGRAIARTGASLKFLQEELGRTSALDTREAINRLIESQIKQRMYANVTEDFSLRTVDRALAPDVNDPKGRGTLVMLVVGAILGFFAGCAAVLLSGAVRDVRSRIQGQS